MEMLRGIKVQAEKNSDELKLHVKTRIDELALKVDTAKVEAKEKETRDKKNAEETNDRLRKIEENMIASKNKCKEREKLANEQIERMNTFWEAHGKQKAIENDMEVISEKRTNTWSDLVEKNKKSEEKKKKEEEDAKKAKHEKEIVNVKKKLAKEKEKEKDAEKKKKIEMEEDELFEKEKKLETDILKKDLKMGDSDHEDEWSWNESDQDWEGTEERREKEREKKIRIYRMKRMKEEKTAWKAKHIIGLGPIRRSSVKYFHDITADHNLAKDMAVKEFLSQYLQFDDEDIANFTILETMISKEDDIIYVTLADHDSIKCIQRRIAEVRIDEVATRVYVPPQYWEWYSALSLYCKEKREKNKDIKTIIRFSDKDLEVLVKDRSKEEQYR